MILAALLAFGAMLAIGAGANLTGIPSMICTLAGIICIVCAVVQVIMASVDMMKPKKIVKRPIKTVDSQEIRRRYEAEIQRLRQEQARLEQQKKAKEAYERRMREEASQAAKKLKTSYRCQYCGAEFINGNNHTGFLPSCTHCGGVVERVQI